MANVACAGCHADFEPLAFGLEQFDGIGAFHGIDEYKNRLRSDGEILIPGTAQPVKYSTPAELMDLLAASERVRETLTWKVVQFARGASIEACGRCNSTADSSGCYKQGEAPMRA